MIAQGIIFCKTIKGNCYDKLVSINVISLSLLYRRFINNKKEARPISRKRIRCTIREWRENSYIIYERRRPLCAYVLMLANLLVRLVLQ